MALLARRRRPKPKNKLGEKPSFPKHSELPQNLRSEQKSKQASKSLACLPASSSATFHSRHRVRSTANCTKSEISRGRRNHYDYHFRNRSCTGDWFAGTAIPIGHIDWALSCDLGSVPRPGVRPWPVFVSCAAVPRDMPATPTLPRPSAQGPTSPRRGRRPYRTHIHRSAPEIPVGVARGSPGVPRLPVPRRGPHTAIITEPENHSRVYAVLVRPHAVLVGAQFSRVHHIPLVGHPDSADPTRLARFYERGRIAED